MPLGCSQMLELKRTARPQLSLITTRFNVGTPQARVHRYQSKPIRCIVGWVVSERLGFSDAHLFRAWSPIFGCHRMPAYYGLIPALPCFLAKMHLVGRRTLISSNIRSPSPETKNILTQIGSGLVPSRCISILGPSL